MDLEHVFDQWNKRTHETYSSSKILLTYAEDTLRAARRVNARVSNRNKLLQLRQLPLSDVNGSSTK